jgi:hypothetical protein
MSRKVLLSKAPDGGRFPLFGRKEKEGPLPGQAEEL